MAEFLHTERSGTCYKLPKTTVFLYFLKSTSVWSITFGHILLNLRSVGQTTSAAKKGCVNTVETDHRQNVLLQYCKDGSFSSQKATKKATERTEGSNGVLGDYIKCSNTVA